LETRIEEMDNQVAALRARLEIFEARAIPYTLRSWHFSRTRGSPGRRWIQGDKEIAERLPAGSAALVAEHSVLCREKAR